MPEADTRLLDEILDTLDSGVVVLDRQQRIVTWNGWMSTMSGVGAPAALGRTLDELFSETDLSRLSAAVVEALDLGASSVLTHKLHRAVLPLVTRAGAPLVHNLTVRPIGARPYKECLIQVTDVTVQAERERVLRERQNARYDALLESAADPILTLDAEGRIQLANRAAGREIGASPKALIGRPFAELLGDASDWDRVWPAVLSGQAVQWPVELALVRQDGSHSYVDASASRWLSDSRVFVTAILRDVNERRTAEAELRRLNETLEERVRARTADLERAHEQLRQSQKMEAIGQLTGGVAHDFNNLLTPILGGLDVLQRRGVGDERGQRLIDGALQSAERARVLVQRLLAFARRQPLQSAAVDTAGLVEDMVDLLSSTLGPRVRVIVDAGDGLPPAQADRNQLEMAVLNLAVNARDAMPDGGVLTISVRQAEAEGSLALSPGRYIRLAVSDTGVGMDPATLARAIEPFFSTKGVGKGTGLGLSMIHGLAAQLGGALQLSSAVGVGTTVEIWLPIADSAAAEAREENFDEPVAGAGVVLLVDDEELIRASTAQMLADLGFTVLEADSGRSALALLHRPKLDLVVTDHLMPGMTGTEFAREAALVRPGVPVLVISGYADLDALAPDLPRLMKPFREVELAQALASLRRPA